MEFEIIVLPFIIGLFFSGIFTPLGIKFANSLKLIDDPKKHKHPAVIHKKTLPRAGGLPIYLAIFVGSIFLLPMSKIFLAILAAGFLIVLIGLLDDRYDLSPYVRFVVNIVCAGIVVYYGVNMPFITNPLGGILHFNSIGINLDFINLSLSLSSVLAVIWIVWVMNMLNWSKGVDGQMPGIVVISAVVIGLASLRFPVLGEFNIDSSQMSFLVAGSAMGFLIYNFYPAKILPGYSSTVLGFCLGVLSLLSGVKLATAILVMGVPMTDAIFTITRRILSKRSPFWHDKGHLHHLMLSLGLDHKKIAVFYWIMSASLGVIALSLSSKGKLFAIILLIVLVSGFIFTLKFINQKKAIEK
ncbi:undecaprenyl/decaprenyl-phosphate alpha-N-acetylglucosaminyl 1-phosphate transferase [Candidatus Parcubacteria bacterium]|nr:MAG: undecaprenyl/decaprenyl-phosphate alpha-N-acetylglucosaminyl 1-phosphate transferase [Candidatus Parcubacteria bacterium]